LEEVIKDWSTEEYDAFAETINCDAKYAGEGDNTYPVPMLCKMREAAK
jgi:hypothetical protein